MKKFITNKSTLYSIGIILFLFVWFIISILINEDSMVLPSPFTTIKYMFSDILSSVYVYKCIGWTLLRMVIGFMLSYILAVIFGTIAGNHPIIEQILKPTMTALKAVPTACLTFLFLVLVTARWAPILVVFMVCFPILYEAVLGGIKNIESGIKDALKLDSKGGFHDSVLVKIPVAASYIIVGIASSFSLGFKIEIMAEIISGDTRNGLGSAILAAQKSDPTNLVPIFAYSLIAIIFILLLGLLAQFVKKTFMKRIATH